MPHPLRAPLSVTCSLAALLLAGGVAAQEPAADFDARYQELHHIAPDADQAADVAGLTLHRDAADFTFTDGTIWLLGPVGGRTVAAAFEGHGTFHFAAPTPAEQEHLQRFTGHSPLDVEFTQAVFYFTDSTLAQLRAGRTFAHRGVPGGLAGKINGSLGLLGDDDHRDIDPDLMTDLLNGTSSGLFYGYVVRTGGGPLMYQLDPYETEAVSLVEHRHHLRFVNGAQDVISQFPRPGDGPATALHGERVIAVRATDYHLESTLDRTSTGDISFLSRGDVSLTADSPAGPWIPFLLFSKLKVDSVRAASGPTASFKGDDGGVLWIRLDHRLAAGDTATVGLSYHGDLIDRYGDWFFIKFINGEPWYPSTMQGRDMARFSLTFHSPAEYPLASVGTRTDSTVADRVLTTKWVTPTPIRNATFNLGLFKDYQVPPAGTPPIDVLWGEERKAATDYQYQIPGRNMRESVGSDVAAALKFFNSVYGDYPAPHFYVTEIPYPEGQAFPGMVDLSAITFHQTGDDHIGFNQLFRAHEVAHQWWGIGVDFATYHDQWLSEGFSDFSGLWYLQTVMKDNGKYFGMLDRWRADIFNHRNEPSPVWLGYRTSSGLDESGYQIIVYEKGAWTLHMLRILLIDLNTMNESRFTDVMRDFYRTYHGKRASTADFQRVVEQHVGQPMGWFFKDWIYGSAIPTYRVATHTEQTSGGYKVSLRVDQEGVPDDFQMYVPVTVDLGQNRVARARVLIKGPHTETALPLLPAEPKSIKFNDLDGVLADVKTVNW